MKLQSYYTTSLKKDATLIIIMILTLLVGRQEAHPACKKNVGVGLMVATF